jgi:hypothetical protein
VERRKELHQIKSLDGILRMIGSPGFLQSCRSSDMSSARSHRCNQYSHRATDVALNRASLEAQKEGLLHSKMEDGEPFDHPARFC